MYSMVNETVPYPPADPPSHCCRSTPNAAVPPRHVYIVHILAITPLNVMITLWFDINWSDQGGVKSTSSKKSAVHYYCTRGSCPNKFVAEPPRPHPTPHHLPPPPPPTLNMYHHWHWLNEITGLYSIFYHEWLFDMILYRCPISVGSRYLCVWGTIRYPDSSDLSLRVHLPAADLY